MSVLVRDDVALREGTALGTELGAQVLEEQDVEIHLPVVRTVEGTHRRLRGAARGVPVLAEEDGRRGRIGLALLRELVAPELLHAIHEADDAAVVALVRLRAGLTIARGRSVLDRPAPRRVDGLEDAGRIDAEEQRRDEDDDPDPPAADEHRSTEAAAADILDLRGVERAIVAECHAAN